MKQFRKYINELDIFGLKIQLNYKRNETHKTVFGGFLTIILYCLFGIAIYYFGKELYEKKEPTTIYNEEFIENPKSFFINNRTFPFSIGLEDGNTSRHYIDEQIFTLEAVN